MEGWRKKIQLGTNRVMKMPKKLQKNMAETPKMLQKCKRVEVSQMAEVLEVPWKNQ